MIVALALAAALAAGPAEPPKFDRDCMDDYGRNLCDAEVRKEIRESFGAPPVEALAKEGWAGVRVYLVDGYSHDLPMVTIARKGDGPVEVETRALLPSGKPRVFRTGLGAWGIQLADFYAGQVMTSPERVTRPDPKKGEPPNFCLHAWVAVTEVFDSKAVYRRVRNACDDDGLFDGAAEMSRVGFDLLEGCNLLSADDYRGHPQRIEACAQLGGDPISYAAFVRNRLGETFVRRPEYLPAGQFADVFALDASLRTAGQTFAGRDAAAAGWTTAMGGGVTFQVVEVTAKRSEVRVRANLIRYHGDTTEVAPVEQTWGQDKDYRWRLRTSSIGAYSVPEDR